MILLNDVLIVSTLFPDKTSQVWKIPEHAIEEYNFIYWQFENEAEFMEIAQLKMLLEPYPYMDASESKISLEIPYLPYARQDKDVSNNTTFALHTFASLLNSLNFNSVNCYDAHSAKAGELINNFKSLPPCTEINYAFFKTESEVLCYPDKGSFDKYQKYYSSLPYAYGEKVRDPLSGDITHYALFGDVKDKKVLIVDDICDGGATFNLLAKDLYTAGAKEVNLFVSHGIFSKGFEPLTFVGIKRIFTRTGEVNVRI